MSTELEVYSGKLIYKNIEFDFVFDGKKLRLIPPKNRINEVLLWNGEKLANGTTKIIPSINYLETDYLKGIINETGQTIIFIPDYLPLGSYQFSIIVVSIKAFALFNTININFNQLSFESQEIDYIFPICDAIDNVEWNDNGVFCIKTKTFEETTSDRQVFFVDGHSVSVHFGITRNAAISSNNNPPLLFRSSMVFEFESTSDILFIIRLWNIAKKFIQYLCYRKNIFIPSINISAPYDDHNLKISTMYIIDETSQAEEELIGKGKYISQKYIAGYEGKILNDIAADKLYNRHIPESSSASNHYNAARFVMITAAFEWEFRKSHPNGVERSSASINAENKATDVLNQLINSSTGKLKSIYKRLLSNIRFDNLQSEIMQTGKDLLDNLMSDIGNYLYSINNSKLNYNEMGDRISKQRNNFAHGNLDMDIIDLSLLDLMFLERVIYAMQLNYWEIPSHNIRHIINDLFNMRLVLSD